MPLLGLLTVAGCQEDPGDGLRQTNQASTAEGSAGFVGADLGQSHGCVIRGDGQIYCWGNNGSGQLGVDPLVTNVQPSLASAAPVTGSVHPVMVAAGGDTSCAVDVNGGVFWWGNNSFGAFGNGAATNASSPTAMHLSTSTAGAAYVGSYFTCVLLDTGHVQCSGYNASGQLGRGTVDTCVSQGVPADGGTEDGGTGDPCVTGEGLDDGGTALNDWTPRDVLIDASTPLANVKQIAVGGAHACALVTGTAASGDAGAQDGGRVFCWGRSLANATASDSAYAVEVAGLTDPTNRMMVRAIAAGGSQTCAVLSNGTAKCWGDATNSSLGDGTTNSSATPVTLQTSVTTALDGGSSNTPLMNVVSIGLGTTHGCAITADGTHRCWGNRDHGQLNDGVPAADAGTFIFTTANNGSLASAGDAGTTTALATMGGEAFGCALTIDGIDCWGDDSFGALGNGTPYVAQSPGSLIAPPTSVNSTDSTFRRGRILDVGGSHVCMGAAAGSHVAPGDTGSGATATDAGAGAATGTTGVACWGPNNSNQLGDGNTIDQNRPRFTQAIPDAVVDVVSGLGHSCALTSRGRVYCWGWNFSGQTGSSTNTQNDTGVSTPTLVSSLENVVALAAGHFHTCALLAGGQVWCWGQNSLSQFATPRGYPGFGDAVSPTPRQVTQWVAPGPGDPDPSQWGWNWTTLENAVAITAGEGHTCALQASGRVMCWGWNEFGQCAQVTGVDPDWNTHLVKAAQPALALGGSLLAPDVISVTAGNRHTCAVTASGGSYCWGDNSAQQIVVGSTAAAFYRGALSMTGRQPNVLALSAGGATTCALHREAFGLTFSVVQTVVSCWGDNTDGHAGASSGSVIGTPQDIAITASDTLFDVAQISVGDSSACALGFDGAVHCWGSNASGQLGRGVSSGALASDHFALSVADLQ